MAAPLVEARYGAKLGPSAAGSASSGFFGSELATGTGWGHAIGEDAPTRRGSGKTRRGREWVHPSAQHAHERLAEPTSLEPTASLTVAGIFERRLGARCTASRAPAVELESVGS